MGPFHKNIRNKDVEKGHEFTGHMVTPDGESPKCIQWCTGHNFSIWLMNNGEVFTSGYNGHYQLGYNEGSSTNTTNRSYTNRVSASDTVDWLGDTIPVSYTHLTLPTNREV